MTSPDQAAADAPPVDPAADLAAMDAAAASLPDDAVPVPLPPPGAPGAQSLEAEYRDLVQSLVFMGGKVLAPAWAITSDEAEALGEAYAPLLAKYFPDGPGQWAAEIAAVSATVVIFGPRIGKPRKVGEDAQEAKGADQGAPGAPAASADPDGVPQVRAADLAAYLR